MYDRLCGLVSASRAAIHKTADALAIIDVAVALANLAIEQNYARPEILDSLDFVIEGGRHPVVEQALKVSGGPFVANDCDLSPPTGATGSGAPEKASPGRI